MKTDVCLSLDASWRPLPGLAPEATHFLLLRQEKVSKEKAPLLSATLRCATGTLRCSVQPGSRSNSPAAQTIASPDPSGPPLLSAYRRGWGKQIPTANFRRTRFARSAPRFRFRFLLPQPRPGWAEQRRRGRIKISDVRRLRSRQVSEISVHSEQRKEPRSGPDCGSPFFSLGFFGEAKKSNSPAGARPGLVVKAPRHNTTWRTT